MKLTGLFCFTMVPMLNAFMEPFGNMKKHNSKCRITIQSLMMNQIPVIISVSVVITPVISAVTITVPVISSPVPVTFLLLDSSKQIKLIKDG